MVANELINIYYELLEQFISSYYFSPFERLMGPKGHLWTLLLRNIWIIFYIDSFKIDYKKQKAILNQNRLQASPSRNTIFWDNHIWMMGEKKTHHRAASWDDQAIADGCYWKSVTIIQVCPRHQLRQEAKEEKREWQRESGNCCSEGHNEGTCVSRDIFRCFSAYQSR